MDRAYLKQLAKQQLGGNIFSGTWMLALAICLVHSLVIGACNSFGIGFVLLGPLNYGLAYVFVKQSRDGKPMEFNDLFKGFSNDFLQNFLINLLSGIFVGLWSLLFIIPGIIKQYSYSMAHYVKLDHPEYNWKTCLDVSRELMNGHKAELFVLELSFIGWHLLCMLTLGIGFLWVIPYQQATTAHFYNALVAPNAYEGRSAAPQPETVDREYL